MSDRRFGEYLARIVTLTTHDIAEILEDQSASGRRFGEIALAWGLCQPQHVWEAWATQLDRRGAHTAPVVDLPAIGIDAQATTEMPASVARRFGVVPVRKTGDALVVAADESGLARAAARVPALLRTRISFVVVPSSQIDAALKALYPRSPKARRSDSAAPEQTPSAAAPCECDRPSAAAARKSPGSPN